MTVDEIRAAVAADPALQAMQAAGNFNGIAEALPATEGASITVEDMFDALFTAGDWPTLKMAAATGNTNAAMAFSILSDAKALGPGMVNLDSPATQGLLAALTADGLLSAPGAEALNAKRPKTKLTWQRVQAALEA